MWVKQTRSSPKVTGVSSSCANTRNLPSMFAVSDTKVCRFFPSIRWLTSYQMPAGPSLRYAVPCSSSSMILQPYSAVQKSLSRCEMLSLTSTLPSKSLPRTALLIPDTRFQWVCRPLLRLARICVTISSS